MVFGLKVTNNDVVSEKVNDLRQEIGVNKNTIKNHLKHQIERKRQKKLILYRNIRILNI
jgi:hypothetical protein